MEMIEYCVDRLSSQVFWGNSSDSFKQHFLSWFIWRLWVFFWSLDNIDQFANPLFDDAYFPEYHVVFVGFEKKFIARIEMFRMGARRFSWTLLDVEWVYRRRTSVWFDLIVNLGLLDHWRTLKLLCQWAGRCLKFHAYSACDKNTLHTLNDLLYIINEFRPVTIVAPFCIFIFSHRINYDDGWYRCPLSFCPLRSNLLRLQCTCCTIPTTSERTHVSPLVWACQSPSSQPLSSPQLSHNDSLWA